MREIIQGVVKSGSMSYRCPLGLPWIKGGFPSSCREADFTTADLLQALSVPQLIALAHQSSATAAEGWVKVLLCFAGQEPPAGTAKICRCFSEFEDAFANRPDLSFHLSSSPLTRTWLLRAQKVWMCVGALLRGHEQDTGLADVGFMPPRPNRWRLWILVDSTVCVRDLCSRRLVVKKAPAALSVGGGGGPDCISWGASGSWGAESSPASPKLISSKRGKSQHGTSSIVLIFCFSLHLIVTVGIMIAVFDQLTSLIISKGMISSRTFAKFGWEPLGLIHETPESCSYSWAALLPASAERLRGVQLYRVTHSGGSRRVHFLPSHDWMSVRVLGGRQDTKLQCWHAWCCCCRSWQR